MLNLEKKKEEVEPNESIALEGDGECSDDEDDVVDQLGSTNGVTKEYYNILFFLDDESRPLGVLEEDEQEVEEQNLNEFVGGQLNKKNEVEEEAPIQEKKNESWLEVVQNQMRGSEVNEGGPSSSTSQKINNFEEVIGGDEVESKMENVNEPICPLIGVASKIGDACRGEEVGELQRENIFYSRCFINQRSCSILIDGGSCKNVISAILVEELKLETLGHPRPYKLQWLNSCGEVKVNKQCKVTIDMGEYKDEVVCDVFPMHVGHILLGRPWMFDRDVVHKGRKNTYSLVMEGRKLTLSPLTPSEVMRDQNILREEGKKRKEEKERQKQKSVKKEEEEKERGQKENQNQRHEVNEEERKARDEGGEQLERRVGEGDKMRETSSIIKRELSDKQESDKRKESGGKMRGKMWIVKRGKQENSEEQRTNILFPPKCSCLNSLAGIDSRTNHFKEGGNDKNRPRLNGPSKEGGEAKKPQLMAPWVKAIFKRIQGGCYSNKANEACQPRARRFVKKWVVKDGTR